MDKQVKDFKSRIVSDIYKVRLTDVAQNHIGYNIKEGYIVAYISVDGNKRCFLCFPTFNVIYSNPLTYILNDAKAGKTYANISISLAQKWCEYIDNKPLPPNFLDEFYEQYNIEYNFIRT